MPAITRDGGDQVMELRVLTYNVEGLPWPVRSGRSRHLREIGDILAAMRARGDGPDIVVLQEAFTSTAGDIARRSTYPNFVRGPDRADRFRPEERPPADDPLRQPILRRGEGLGALLSSGLYILSEFPILSKETRPFSRLACAGYDCLANKGVVLARLAVPGLPEPLHIATTHLNAQGAAGVPRDRTHFAHHRQIDELAAALEEWRPQDTPLIIAGDFNVRHAPSRFDFASHRKGLEFVRPWCQRTGSCAIEVTWATDAPWLTTQDLQAFGHGEQVTLRPLRLSYLFDGLDEPELSDHWGYMVTYELRWRAPDALAAQPAGPVPGPMMR